MARVIAMPVMAPLRTTGTAASTGTAPSSDRSASATRPQHEQPERRPATPHS
jgi:hypothetical protein